MEEKILVVDDEKDICDILQFNLEHEGYKVDLANSAEDALAILTDKHSLIILDVMMGGMSGFKMAERLRKEDNHIPIIFLTAKNTENDMLTGFSTGGDDYVAKPFSVKELLARVKSVLKRTNSNKKPAQTLLQHEGLVVDILNNRVTINDVEVSLTKKEFDLLIYFLGNKNRVLSKSTLAEHLSGDFADMLDNHDFVYAHVKNLKKKLTEAGCDNYLRTVYGTGYKWESN